jgi:hypothetical protein
LFMYLYSLLSKVMGPQTNQKPNPQNPNPK